MPPTYLDSIPLSIAAFVTRFQFQMIMMEIDTANIDISQIPVNCTRDIIYNVPIVYNKRVQQALLALLAAEKSERMIRILNRSIFYRPFMEKMFEEEGLPTDITYLPLLESAFNPRAYSRAHASGLWQFIPSTGKIFGLRDSYWLDERRDPIKSTAAAIAYFKRLYALFDDWYLALASYNCGEGKVGRLLGAAKEKNPKANYWDLPLPRETMSYVPLYIGYQIIAKNPKCFGFIADSAITPFPYDTVKISDCVDMGKIAKGLDIDANELREINPHIKQFCTPPDAKDVTLYIPAGKKDAFKEFYAALKPEDKVKWYLYRVVAGDNLGIIAKKFGTTTQVIRDMNRMKNNTLSVGRNILLPLPDDANLANKIMKAEEEARKIAASRPIQKPTGSNGKVNYKISSGETFYSVAKLYGVSVNDIVSWNPNLNPRYLREGDIVVVYTDGAPVHSAPQPIQPKPAHSGNKREYVVKNGDNLYQISLKLQVSLSDLISWNGKNSGNPVIHPGETLVYYATGAANSGVREVRAAVSGNSKAIDYRAKTGDTFYSIARAFSMTVAELETLNNMKAGELKAGQMIKVLDNTPSSSVNPKTDNTEFIAYKVKTGDYIYKLARDFNVSVQEICLMNNFSSDRQLVVGEIIKIPVKQ
jgi:membrane-bound lytic murein transglycosylase D